MSVIGMGLHRVGTLGHIVASSNIFYQQDSGQLTLTPFII